MPPAARKTDLQLCPTGKSSAPIATGAETVLIEGLPAARVGDTSACADGPTKIESGCATVIIEGSRAARITDTTCHMGKIIIGATTVLVGDQGGGSATGTMDAAHNDAAPFVTG